MFIKMLIKLLHLFTLLPTAIARVPMPVPIFDWAPSPASLTLCTQFSSGTFKTKTPSRWDDCAALFSAWQGVNGTFTIYSPDDIFLPILDSQSCTFALKGDGPYEIGDWDVGFLLNVSLTSYSDGSEVAAQGELVCGLNGGLKLLEWQLWDAGINGVGKRWST